MKEHPPGLISWKKTGCSLGYIIEEEWDLTAKGCPILAFKINPGFERDNYATYFRRSYLLKDDE
jgi:hypothetical protein